MDPPGIVAERAGSDAIAIPMLGCPMNVSQAKKLAKNLRKAWPSLVAEHGDALALHDAQEVIARIQGYPHWNAFQQAAVRSKRPECNQSDGSIYGNLRFVPVAPPELLATRYNEERDQWTHYIEGIEVVLRPASDQADVLINQVSEELYAELEQRGGRNGEYPDDPSALDYLVEHARHAVRRCPFSVEAINVLSGLLYSRGRLEEALAVVEPAATSLLEMIPTENKVVHVPYGYVLNRPFFRLCHVYLLLLHQADRHKEATALAKRMHRYCPSDNMGFRFFKTITDRVTNLSG
jgi:hypothetical protein